MARLYEVSSQNHADPELAAAYVFAAPPRTQPDLLARCPVREFDGHSSVRSM
jgi:hypothetical protein